MRPSRTRLAHLLMPLLLCATVTQTGCLTMLGLVGSAVSRNGAFLELGLRADAAIIGAMVQSAGSSRAADCGSCVEESGSDEQLDELYRQQQLSERREPQAQRDARAALHKQIAADARIARRAAQARAARMRTTSSEARLAELAAQIRANDAEEQLKARRQLADAPKPPAAPAEAAPAAAEPQPEPAPAPPAEPQLARL